MVSEPVVFQTTRVFEDIMDAWLGGKRGILLEGGTRSGKTWSVLQFLHLVAQSAKEPLVISVVSESLPHLKLGCVRDFFKILNESPDNNPRWSKTEFRYTYPRAVIEFWGTDNEGKARGPTRDILFVNEGNNTAWSTIESADARTTKFILVDWNPTGEFWVHSYMSGGQQVEGWIKDSRFAYSHSTYQDARGLLPASVVENIESRRDKDPNWWSIYGLGQPGGKIEGLVYPKFEQCDSLPDGVVFYGLDFGFTNDPAVLVANVINGGNLYSRELFYERGLTNDDIARKMALLNVRGTIWADSAEPKSIEELVRKGFNVLPSEKGPGSVEFGHQRVNQYYQFWTKDSVDCIREQRNFRYKKNIQGMLTDNTTHEWSHGMDARRYAVGSNQLGNQQPWPHSLSRSESLSGVRR